MKLYYSYIFLIFSLLHSIATAAQTIPADDNTIRSAYPFLTISNNTISNSQGLDSFYKKLALFTPSIFRKTCRYATLCSKQSYVLCLLFSLFSFKQ